MNSKERILKYLEYKGISKRKFYLKSGLSNGFLDKTKNIGSDKLESIISIYNDINLSWLITGKGKMIEDKNSQKEVEKNIVSEQSAEYKTDKENFLLNMLDKKDKEITQLNRTIGKLENQIEQLKKENPHTTHILNSEKKLKK